jgi:hypothetical protein
MPVDDGAATWSGIYNYEFKTCRLDICHGGGTAKLNMATKESAYASLVDQPALAEGQCAKLNKLRVAPNDPDNSLLYLKLSQTAPCGQQMPPGGLFKPDARERLREWILQGAKND